MLAFVRAGRSNLVVWSLGALLATEAPRAVAAPSAAAAPSAIAGPNDDPKTLARSIALEGTRSADGGDHEKALLLFRDAYARYQEPAYLYDIAVECQTLGRDADAIDAYERFLADPRTTPQEFVAHATQQRDELTARIRTKRAAEAANTPPPAPGEESTEPTPFSQRLAWQLGAGAGFWTSGIRGEAHPSPVFSIGAGYLVASLPGDVDVHLGGKFALTYFKEPGATNTFMSLLANPTVSKRLTSAFTIFAELGVGLLVLSGVPDNSVLLEAKGGRPTAAFSVFELRPGLGASYAVTNGLSIYIAPAFAWNPRPDMRFEGAALSRVELAIGVNGGR